MRQRIKPKTKRPNLSVNPDIHAVLKQISERTGRKMNVLTDEALRNYTRNYPLSQVQTA